MTLEKMLEELVGLIVSVTNCDACLVYLLEEEAGEIVLCASQLPHTKEIGQIRMKIGEGVAGWVAKKRAVVALAGYVAEQMGGAIAKARLKDENARLVAELESRKILERAKGILQQRHGFSEEDAYLQLRSESRRLRRPMKELAEAVILSEELHRKGRKKDDGEKAI